MARCKLYEIPGPDAARTASAVRCHRDATTTTAVGETEIRVCAYHLEPRWTLFVRDGWVYAVDIDAEVPPPRAKRDEEERPSG